MADFATTRIDRYGPWILILLPILIAAVIVFAL